MAAGVEHGDVVVVLQLLRLRRPAEAVGGDDMKHHNIRLPGGGAVLVDAFVIGVGVTVTPTIGNTRGR